jgi:hypothetical protein
MANVIGRVIVQLAPARGDETATFEPPLSCGSPFVMGSTQSTWSGITARCVEIDHDRLLSLRTSTHSNTSFAGIDSAWHERRT